MSHGERFVAMIQAMMNAPGLYVMDEPEAALSFSSCLHLVAVLHQLARSGAQIVCDPLPHPGRDTRRRRRRGRRPRLPPGRLGRPRPSRPLGPVPEVTPGLHAPRHRSRRRTGDPMINGTPTPGTPESTTASDTAAADDGTPIRRTAPRTRPIRDVTSELRAELVSPTPETSVIRCSTA